MILKNRCRDVLDDDDCGQSYVRIEEDLTAELRVTFHLLLFGCCEDAYLVASICSALGKALGRSGITCDEGRLKLGGLG